MKTLTTGFYRLPNAVSHQSFDFDQLQDMLQRILAGRLGAADGNERKTLLERHMTALDGPLACERMVEVLENMSEIPGCTDNDSLLKQLERWALGKGLRLVRGIKSSLPGSHNKPEFQRHRYPGIAIEEIKTKVSRFQQLLGDDRQLEIVQLSDVMFRIN